RITIRQVDYQHILRVFVQIPHPTRGILGLARASKPRDRSHCLSLDAVRLDGLYPTERQPSDRRNQDQQRPQTELIPAASGALLGIGHRFNGESRTWAGLL